MTRQESCSISSHATHQSRRSTHPLDCKEAPAPFPGWPHNLTPGSETGEVCFVKLPQLGFPLSYEVFAGNRADVTTLEEMLDAVERKHGRARRVWVFDRGIVSEENLQSLRRRAASYLVGTPRARLKAYERRLLAGDWQKVSGEVEVQLIAQDKETYVLARSRARAQKESAMRLRVVRGLMRDLIRLRRLSWVEDPISSLSGMRQHFKRTMRSPLLASIYANGQLVSEGNVEVLASQGRGIFWPIDQKRLDTSFPEARLYVTGISGAFHIKDVHQCSGTPLHWEFFMT